MRQDELHADTLPEAVTHKRDEQLDPAHQVREEAFTLGVHLVHEAVERLLMPFDKIDINLNGLGGVRLTD